MQEYFFPEKGLVRAHRPSQLQMAEIVQQIVTEGGIALIQAPTGTGKTYAYGVPSVLSDRRVIVSTAKKALQHQIADKDLPVLTKIIRARSYGVLKGKGNYLCSVRADEFLKNTQALQQVNPVELRKFEDWLESDPENVDLDGQWTFGTQVCVTECLKRACPQYAKCHYVKNKAGFKLANVGMVNHALLAQEVRMGDPGKLVGDFDVLIIDEAHHFVRAVQDAVAAELNQYIPHRLEKIHGGVFGLDFSPKVKDLFERLFDELGRRPDGELPMGDFSIKRLVEPVTQELRVMLADVMPFLRPYLEQANAQGFEGLELNETALANVGYEDAKEIIRGMYTMTTLQDTLRALDCVLAKNPTLEQLADLETTGVISEEEAKKAREAVSADDADVVCHVRRMESAQHKTTILRVDPMHVGHLVRSYLTSIKSVILTSATLTPKKEFTYVQRELGLYDTDVKRAEILPPVFNYRTQCLAFIDDTMPTFDGSSLEAKQPYYDAIANSCHDLLQHSEGGAFVLFPSWGDLRSVYKRLERLPGATYRLIMQSDAPARDVDLFKTGIHNVLLGTKSLWEGVDVPGMALRMVIVSRLPFPPLNDALISKRKNRLEGALLEQGMNEWAARTESYNRICTSSAAIELAQAVGRLIRSETDKGVIAILDPRMGFSSKAKKSYAAMLRDVLPVKPTTDRSLVHKILENHLAYTKKQAA